MKKLFILLLIVFIGCSKKEKLFLDFYIGMSSDEFSSVKDRLVQEGKLIEVNNIPFYIFEFPDSTKSIEMSLVPYYISNKGKYELDEISLFFPMDEEWARNDNIKWQELIDLNTDKGQPIYYEGSIIAKKLGHQTTPNSLLSRVRVITTQTNTNDIHNVVNVLRRKYGTPILNRNDFFWQSEHKAISIESDDFDGDYYKHARIIFKQLSELEDKINEENAATEKNRKKDKIKNDF